MTRTSKLFALAAITLVVVVLLATLVSIPWWKDWHGYSSSKWFFWGLAMLGHSVLLIGVAIPKLIETWRSSPPPPRPPAPRRHPTPVRDNVVRGHWPSHHRFNIHHV